MQLMSVGGLKRLGASSRLRFLTPRRAALCWFACWQHTTLLLCTSMSLRAVQAVLHRRRRQTSRTLLGQGRVYGQQPSSCLAVGLAHAITLCLLTEQRMHQIGQQHLHSNALLVMRVLLSAPPCSCCCIPR